MIKIGCCITLAYISWADMGDGDAASGSWLSGNARIGAWTVGATGGGDKAESGIWPKFVGAGEDATWAAGATDGGEEEELSV